MILFVGSEEKGHFIREVAKSYQWNAACERTRGSGERADP